jgi:tRNA nucleotidyltransferase (CCA-adding enzyme)
VLEGFRVHGKDFADLMRSTLNPEVIRHLEICGRIGDERDTNTYAVGGFVRDLLLKRPGVDIDVVVEGDGVAYSKALVSELGGDLQTYDDFGTATIVSDGGLRLDIASARRETYEQPGELPKVSVGNLKDDMFRRDFTVNSMALSLNSRSLGHLVDFFSGERDISRGMIRVLHDKSFEDDPTRILRAIRFETRFGFNIEPKTERLIQEALSSGMLGRLTPERKRYELELMLSEEKAAVSIERMRKLKVLRHLAPGLKSPTKKEMERIGAGIEEFGKRLRLKRWFVYIISLIDTLPISQAVEFGKSIALKKKELRKVIQVKMSKQGVRGLETEEPITPSSVFRVLEPLSPEGLVYYYSLQKKQTARERFARYLRKDRGTRLLMTGDDLKRLRVTEGPIYKEVLQRVLDARIDGEVLSLDDEIRLARKIVEAS